MKTFKSFKDQIIKLSKESGATCGQLDRAINCQTKKESLQILKDNCI